MLSTSTWERQQIAITENQMFCTIWSGISFLKYCLLAWVAGGGLLCLRYFHGSGAITRSEQQSSNLLQSSRNSATKKLQHPPFNSSNYTGEWAASGDNTFFLHFLVSPVYLDIPVCSGFYYLNWFVQMVSTLDFLKFPVAFKKATQIYLCIQALINLFWYLLPMTVL